MAFRSMYTGPAPAEVGLSVCSPDSAWEGFATGEEAEAAVADSEVDSCTVHPAQVSYWLGMPIPRSPRLGAGGKGFEPLRDLRP